MPAQEQFLDGLAWCEKFFMGEAEVQKALFKLVDILDTEEIPHVVIGALALNEYGHRRATVDVDLILRDDDLQRFTRKYLGQGYTERVLGTGKLIDTGYNVEIDVFSAGRFQGTASRSRSRFRIRRQRHCMPENSRSCRCRDSSSSSSPPA